jgi:hypothetical protein
MFLHVVKARHVREYVIWVKFNDGVEGKVNFAGELEGEVFEPLKNVEEFRKFIVDEEMGTIVWENGADVAPEWLNEYIINERKT